MFDNSYEPVSNVGSSRDSEISGSSHRSTPAHAAAGAHAERSSGRALHEKRVLLSLEEEADLEALVKDLGEALGTHVKASHVIRALITLMLRNRRGVVRGAMATGGRLKRPRNGDFAALVRFEGDLGTIFVKAILAAEAGGDQLLSAT